jgi:copper resistance protein C
MRIVHPLAIAAMAGSFAFAAPAIAHPKLLSSTPAANASVPGPSDVTLTFSEKLMPRLSGMDIVMTGMPGMPNHRMKVTGFRTAISGDGKTLVAKLPRPLAAGAYQIAWHAVSADTHRIEGTVTFTVR